MDRWFVFVIRILFVLLVSGSGWSWLVPARASPGVPDPVASSPRSPFSSPEEVFARFAHEPGIHEVQAWALRHARLDTGTLQGLWRASRSFAVLPQVTVEYRLKDGWDQDFRYVDEQGLGLAFPGQSAFALLDDGGADQDAQYVFRARWELSKLVMSSERIRVLAETHDAVKLRDQLLSEVTRLYFDRRRLQTEMLLAPRPDLAGRVREEVELSELTARLDALTGGAFGRALGEPR